MYDNEWITNGQREGKWQPTTFGEKSPFLGINIPKRFLKQQMQVARVGMSKVMCDQHGYVSGKWSSQND